MGILPSGVCPNVSVLDKPSTTTQPKTALPHHFLAPLPCFIFFTTVHYMTSGISVSSFKNVIFQSIRSSRGEELCSLLYPECVEWGLVLWAQSTFVSISNNRASDKPHWLRYCYCAKLSQHLFNEKMHKEICSSKKHLLCVNYMSKTDLGPENTPVDKPEETGSCRVWVWRWIQMGTTDKEAA